ncbi:MAG: hypothetical protein OXI67_12945 [Candidatus Poribacteria bacterium]|nr:hypothetical protein [Candidatus Poribacteria bacterium]
MNTVIGRKLYLKRTFFVCIGIASFLQWLIYQLLTQAKLGSSAECFALAQTFVVFLVAPYLAAISVRVVSRGGSSAHLLSLSPISFGNRLLMGLAISQTPLLCWIFLSSGFALFASDMSIGKAVKMLVVLGLYSFSTGAVGMLGAYVLRDNIFGTGLTYFFLCILIGSAFLLMPLGRYINNLQPVISPVLHLNPLIAVCNIFDGMDIFRTPLFYERTPITSYDFSYPSWYVITFWQLLIGGCCFLLTWQMCRPTKFNSIW